jgi:hypothetical protein
LIAPLMASPPSRRSKYRCSTSTTLAPSPSARNRASISLALVGSGSPGRWSRSGLPTRRNGRLSGAGRRAAAPESRATPRLG